MSEPDGHDATRRTLLRGVVVLGAVGAGAGLSRLGEGTFELTANTGAQSDIVAQTAPVDTAAPIEPTASAAPTKSAKTAKAAKSTKAKSAESTKAKSTEAKSAKSAESTKAKSAKSGKTTASAKSGKSGKTTASAKSGKSGKPDKAAKAAKAAKPAGTPLGPASKVPVGGGAIYKEKRVVVTQPKAGEYKAFDALCTHANCLVDEVKDGAIHCPCHTAKFSIADGSVQRPSVARRPLTPKKVTEADGTIYLT